MKGIKPEMIVKCNNEDCIYNKSMYNQYNYCGYKEENKRGITINIKGNCKYKKEE